MTKPQQNHYPFKLHIQTGSEFTPFGVAYIYVQGGTIKGNIHAPSAYAFTQENTSA